MGFQRQRLTWQGRKASAHPAYPDEGPASPAYPGADPEADAYENGNPSSWAEDPHPGPYTNSAHPAYPDEGPASPAYKAAALERKAAKCIRIASAILGRKATRIQVENKAVELMDLSDRAVNATLSRLAKAGEEAEEEAEEESSKTASFRSRRTPVRSASRSRRAYGDTESMLEEMLAEEGMMGKHSDEEAMLEEMLAEEGMHTMSGSVGHEESSLEEMMLEEMLHEEGVGHEEGMGHEESSLEEMLAEEGMDAAEEACGIEGMGESFEDTDFNLSMDSELDPMGFDEEFMGEDEMQVLASIYGDKQASKQATSKQASQVKPQPKRASNGATRLGGVTKEASGADDLAKLWESAPDISKHF